MIYDEFPELYDAQYLSYRDDLPFYLRVADDVGGPVLELGAGTGRVTESLARAGHEVTAVDASTPMLQRARERLEASGIETGEGGQVRLVSADMRELDLQRRYPLVVAPFNTLAHAYTLEDQDRVLSVVHSHLEEGGVFAFDLFVPRFGQLGVLRSEPSLAEPVRESLRGHTAGRVDLFVSQRDDPERQLLESTYYLDTVGQDGTLRRSVTTLLQRYFTRFELERMIRSAGFALTLYGGFDRSRFDSSSAHYVGLARRRS